VNDLILGLIAGFKMVRPDTRLAAVRVFRRLAAAYPFLYNRVAMAAFLARPVLAGRYDGSFDLRLAT
jgi:hypothetical protein